MPLNIKRIDARRGDAQAAIAELRAKLAPSGNIVSEAGRRKTLEVFGKALSPAEVVEQICSDVRTEGLSAVLRYTAKLDGAELTAETLRVPASDLAAAHAKVSPDFLATVRRIRDNILRFQTAILHADVEIDGPNGSKLGQKYLPLERVGICVPGGAAAYPSTVLMTAVPAQAAGVQDVVVVSPPTPNGAYNEGVLATCHELGIREVYRVGGAQGVAALAYGVADLGAVPLVKVDKIVGPGNQFVALAKRFVFGEVDIDSIAGPSEIVVIADETTRADFAAADLIAQAEHSPGSSVLITWSDKLVDAVTTELEKQLASAARGELARQSLEAFGALIVVKDANAAADMANTFATEHLHIACAAPEKMLSKIRNAGAVFLGPFSPVALGDYVAGPSHVLPTGATARFASGLSSNDFLRSHSVIQFTQAGLENVAEDALRMAEREGLAAAWGECGDATGANGRPETIVGGCMTIAFVVVSIVAYLLLFWICARQGMRRGWANVFRFSDSPAWSVFQAIALLSILGASFAEVFSRGLSTGTAYAGLNFCEWAATVFATFVLARCLYVVARE